jgi:hypothetical protein
MKQKSKLELEVKRQHELLQQALKQVLGRNEDEHTGSQTQKVIGEEEGAEEEGLAVEAEGDGEGDAEELADYSNSQESAESFRSKMERVTGKKITAYDKREEENNPRRCNRLKDKEEMRVEDMAKESVAAKDDYGMDGDSLNILNSSYMSLAKMAHTVGIDLGCS